MKNSILNVLYFSFPEKRSLVVFLSFIAMVHVLNIIYSRMNSNESYDLSLYHAMFEKSDDHIERNEMSRNTLKTREDSIERISKLVNGPVYQPVPDQMPENSSPRIEKNFVTEELLENKNIKRDYDTDSIIINPKTKAIKVAVNSAEEYELQYIKGIGPSFAGRIVKYRNLLGGFYSLNQLKEVYGIDDELFDRIKDQIEINGPVKKIPLNQPDPPYFSHPYLTKLQAKIIRAYIIQHGPINEPQELLKIKIISQETIDKIKPYLPQSMDH